MTQTLNAVQVAEPPCVLLIASPGPVWRLSQAGLRKRMNRHQMVRARRMGVLHDVRHITYDPNEAAARLSIDGIGRPELIVGTLFVRKLLASGPDETTGPDLFAALDNVLERCDDVDQAIADLSDWIEARPAN